MDKVEPKKQTSSLADLSWRQILGLALFFAGISEFLRNFWRIMDGENAFVLLAISVVLIPFGIWLYKQKKS